MEALMMKLKKHGDHNIVPTKYYIVIGPVTRVVKGSILLKCLPRSPLKASNGRMSRLADYEDKLSPSNGRLSRLFHRSEM